jgi:glycosyltransferase involved in cell wall biosynthesis
LDILAELPSSKEAILLLVGDGPACADLRNRAAQLGISDRLRITGIVPREEIAEHVATFDIALQPGVTAYASPLKLLEYMGAGLAIVAPDQANIRELLTDRENALLIDPTDTAALGSAIFELCQDDALRLKLGQAARETIERRKLTWVENATTVVKLVQREQRRHLSSKRSKVASEL